MVALNSKHDTRGGGWVVLAALLMLAAAILVLVCTGDVLYMSEAHAIERHGHISITIREVCEANPVVKMSREIDGRKGIGCEYSPGKFGVAIYEEDGDFVTAFKNKAGSVRELIQYFKNRGYAR